jgi:endonuclease
VPIYDKSTNQLLVEYIHENLGRGQTLEREQIAKWFKDNYPKIRPGTVACHIIKFTTNHKTRIHYGARPHHDILYQLPNKQLRLYDKETDPKPIYSLEDTLPDHNGDDTGTEAASSEFAYESHLRDYLASNLERIETGLRLYTDEEDENIKGVEFDAGGRRIDILAFDKENRFVVIELKVSRGYERSVGQLLRYKAWVKQNLADGKKVRGIVIAKQISEDLKLATSEIADIDLFEYDLRIDLRKVKSGE